MTFYILKKKEARYGPYSKGQFLNPTGNSTYRQEKDRECFYTLCPLFLTSTAFVVTTAYSEIFCFAKCEIMFCRTLWNISLCSMWNEINPLTPAGISLAESEFHAQSAFHKSRKGFISLRSVLKGTAHTTALLFFICWFGNRRCSGYIRRGIRGQEALRRTPRNSGSP